MERISAAGNLTIEMLPGQWRLMTENGEQTHTIVEALTGQPLSYTDMFASKRRLPSLPGTEAVSMTRCLLGIIMLWAGDAWDTGGLGHGADRGPSRRSPAGGQAKLRPHARDAGNHEGRSRDS